MESVLDSKSTEVNLSSLYLNELEIDFVKLSSRRRKMSRLIINLSKHEINSFLEIKGVNIPSGHHRPYHMVHMLWHFIYGPYNKGWDILIMLKRV